MSKLKIISDQIAELLPLLGSQDFFPTLIRTLRQWVAVDEGTVLVYPAGGDPVIAYRENGGSNPGLDTFIAGPFLLDPFYVAAARRKAFGFFTLKQLAPRGFRSSEYYRVYYRFVGLSDECGYLAPLADGGFVNISLARLAGPASGRPFERSSLVALGELTSLVAGMTQQHWHSLVADGARNRGPQTLRAQLEDALARFGENCLTPREQQITHAILHGHTSQALAVELGISVETVKLHRKNAYRKLAVRNQTELFHTFLETLKSYQQPRRIVLEDLSSTPLRKQD